MKIKKSFFAFLFIATAFALFSQETDKKQVNDTGDNDTSQSNETIKVAPAPNIEVDTKNKSTDEKIEQERKKAQNIIYKGEHHLNIGVGMNIPMFINFYNQKETIGNNGYILATDFYDPPVGLSGFFDYKYFLEGGWAIGAELGGSYMRTKQNSQTLIHLGFEATYMIRRWPIDIPISFEVGGHFNTLRQDHAAQNIQSGGFFMKPEIGFIYNFNDEWGLGGSFAWWIIPEIYTGKLKNQSAIANTFSLAIDVRYRFK